MITMTSVQQTTSIYANPFLGSKTYPIDQLSYREMEVLRLVALGLSSDEIASSLNLSIHTVKSHRKNIIMKLNARNVAHMVAIAFLLGLIQ